VPPLPPADPQAPRRAHAAVAIVHAGESNGGSVLLLRRNERDSDYWSGHWCFPGGRRHPEDVDLVATALRELHEECGLVLSRDTLEAELPVGKAGSPERHVLVAPFVFHVSSPIDVVPSAREMAEARWLAASDFRDVTRHGLRTVPGQPAERAFPSFELPPVPLWGFTYRLLCEWLGVEIG
jgi:8-oxo-dGTP diphosphatase